MHKLIVSLSRLYPINKVTLDPLKIVKSVLNLELSAKNKWQVLKNNHVSRLYAISVEIKLQVFTIMVVSVA